MSTRNSRNSIPIVVGIAVPVAIAAFHSAGNVPIDIVAWLVGQEEAPMAREFIIGCLFYVALGALAWCVVRFTYDMANRHTQDVPPQNNELLRELQKITTILQQAYPSVSTTEGQSESKKPMGAKNPEETGEDSTQSSQNAE